MSVEIGVIIPIKKLEEAKSSFKEVLSEEQRSDLVLTMLEDILSAVKKTGSFNSLVVSPDEKVLKFARKKRAETLKEDNIGLNGALELAIKKSMKKGMREILILPGDVPMITSSDLEKISNLREETPNIVITPSKEDGTNALFLHPPDVIDLHFGGRSFPDHFEEARKSGIKPKIYHSERIERDIDSPKNLLKLETLGKGTKTHSFLNILKNNDLKN